MRWHFGHSEDCSSEIAVSTDWGRIGASPDCDAQSEALGRKSRLLWSRRSVDLGQDGAPRDFHIQVCHHANSTIEALEAQSILTTAMEPTVGLVYKAAKYPSHQDLLSPSPSTPRPVFDYSHVAMVSLVKLLALGALTVSYSLGHPGHDIREEAAERREFLKRSNGSVRSCKPELGRRGLHTSSLERRQQLAQEARVQRGLTDHPLVRRDFYQALNTSHDSASDISLGGDERLLFDDNSTCILQPEVTQGPYWVDGELIRSNITEDQLGIPLYLDIQLIDTASCLPVPAVYMDIWHCNSTGVYSGVAAMGNGNSNDTSNLNATWLRGIQQTDSNGVAQFTTIFPGHYTGRATHIHVLAHNPNDTVVRTNATLLSGNFTAHASHVGQIFFDQDLISNVEKTSPYSTNKQTVTRNIVDYLLFEEAATMDPMAEYVLLGDDITDGVMAWISIGIDPTADAEILAAAAVYKSNGEMNPTRPADLGFSTDEENAIRSSLQANAPPASTST